MAKAILVSGARQMIEIRFGCLGEEDKAFKEYFAIQTQNLTIHYFLDSQDVK